MSENQENLPVKSEPAPSGTGEHTLKQSSLLIGSTKEMVEVYRHQSFTGPIPHPALLQQYNQCVEGGAHRIIRMAEAEGDHRRAMEMLTVQKTFTEAARGQYCAVGIACLGIVGAVYAGAIRSPQKEASTGLDRARSARRPWSFAASGAWRLPTAWSAGR